MKRFSKSISTFFEIGATINGKLTVSENVADLGGIAAALEAAKREPDFSAEEFFYNFGRIWRMKGRPEFMKLLASVDVHAPAKLRVNVQVPNFDDFFTTYDVKKETVCGRSPRRPRRLFGNESNLILKYRKSA